MKILFTGGGTGGHFYPIIAIAQAINEIQEKEKLIGVELFYMSDSPYNERLLFETGISYKQVSAGKIRRYFSLKNFTDILKTLNGIISAIAALYIIYPDVVFGKGGYASFPTLMAARILRIPVVIHESDSHPGRVNLWAGKFAKKIAVAYPEALKYFPKDKVAVTGLPIRKSLLSPIKKGAVEFLGLEQDVPIVYITGGSQGAVNINDAIIDILPELVKKYQIVHQTGINNIDDVRGRALLNLEGKEFKERYRPFAYLNETAQRMVAGVASIVISRAGATSIFEIAAWGIPSIIIPIPEEVSHDQRTNAFSYARSGGAIVVEEKNLSGTILLSEINRLLSNPHIMKNMNEKALSFAPRDAAEVIARELISIGLKHEG
ncbi:MAG: undecaprenyldiphospho-muramoylpentapeptide beta-N-acetylglucosaminyltransferase [Candidatus Vogelbacteria bacterium]|nr:undecaprenyldiphospho-muramoylpentapeptide beta-N-acetylglucosaminyltransferase [Candidatus Vogelbacteria bacterium]